MTVGVKKGGIWIDVLFGPFPFVVFVVAVITV